MLLPIALFAGIFCVGCGARSNEILLESQEDTASDIVEETDQEEGVMTGEVPSATPEPQEIFVDVCGAVNQPGVYEMDPDSRVFQAIEAAGGMTEEASGISVNQAQPLSDGQQVYVPTVQEAEEGSFVPAVPETTGTGESMGTEDGIVNLNTADAETLKTLSGIGDSKAQAILAYREEHGGFSSIEEIMQVPGIKESTFSMIKDKIAVK